MGGFLFSNARGSCSVIIFDCDDKEYDCENEVHHLKEDISFRITNCSVPPCKYFRIIWLKWYDLLPFSKGLNTKHNGNGLLKYSESPMKNID